VGRFPKLVPERFYNYVSNGQPDPPGGVEEGETWYDPDTANSYVYDGAVWVDLTVVAHSQLSGISSDDHHNPVTTSDPLTVDAGQGLGMSLASTMQVDGNGDLDLGFDPATQSELDNHTNNSTAHHSKPSSTNSTGGGEIGRSNIGFSTSENVFWYFHEIEVQNNSGDSESVTIYYADGSTQQEYVSGGGATTWISLDPSKLVVKVTESSSTSITQINAVDRVGSHSHSI
jgi:hypothetical protein